MDIKVLAMQRYRWKSNIKSSFSKVGCVDANYAAQCQNWAQRLNFMVTVIYLQIL
jgi:hypothetical protein